MPSNPRVGCFTLSNLTVAPTSGYTGYIGSRERITPMDENKGIAAVEHVAIGLRESLVTEFQSPMGRVARALKAIPGVDSVWPDGEWSRTLLVSVRSEGGDS